MATTLPPSGGPSGSDAALIATIFAEADASDSSKSDRASKATALKNEIIAALQKIADAKMAADKKLSADMSKADGGFWGSLIGILTAVLVVVVIVILIASSVFTGPLGIAAAIGLMAALAGGALTAGPALGNAVGSKNSEGDQNASNAAQQAADTQELLAKDAEQLVNDLSDRTKSDDQFYQTILQDARKLLTDMDQQTKSVNG